MESNNTYKPSSEAFSRYFAGESTQNELTQIENWAQESAENLEELQLLRSIWQDVGSLHTEPVQVDAASAFAKVKAKKAAHTSSSPGFWNAWKVAAVIFLAVSALLLLIQDDNDVQLVAESITEVALSDSTKITVNEGSTLIYEKNFNTSVRKVSLSGEAFFDVARNEEKPFVVQVGEVTVTVLGTSFNIKESDKSVNVAVATGRVEVKSSFGTEILSAGEQVTVNLAEKELKTADNSSSGMEQYWFSKKLVFTGSNLATVLSDLESTYRVKIKVSNETILNCKFQATFENQSIDEILEIIGLSQGLTVEQTNEGYQLSGEGCND